MQNAVNSAIPGHKVVVKEPVNLAKEEKAKGKEKAKEKEKVEEGEKVKGPHC